MRNKTIKLCLLLFHLLVLSVAVSFGDTAKWTCDAGDGKWSNPFNWESAVLPSNTSDVTITNACPSLVDESFSVRNLTIDAGGRVEVPANTTLGIFGDTIMDDGQLFLNGAGASGAVLNIVGASVTLMGSGWLTMSDSPGNVITGIAGSVFINQLSSDQGIQGAGRIGDGQLSLQNLGTINANVQTLNHLIIGPNSNGMFNAGILKATGGGVLSLKGSFTNLEQGEIQANGGTVELIFAAISGGTLSTSAGGVIKPQYFDDATLNDLTLANACNYQIPFHSGTTLSGTITNNGTIQLLGRENENAYLNLSTTVAVRGSGSITMMGQYNSIYGDGSLLNQQLIQGASGTINVASLNNQGTIRGLSSNFPLTIQIGSNGAINTGLIQAPSGAQVSLVGGTLINDGGVIAADNGLVTADGQVMAKCLSTT